MGSGEYCDSRCIYLGNGLIKGRVMTARSNLVKIAVRLEPRGDGGLRAYSDDVPGFVLSHSDAGGVLADVKPALEIMLSALFNVSVKVTELASVRDLVNDALGVESDSPLSKAVTRDYVGLLRAA